MRWAAMVFVIGCGGTQSQPQQTQSHRAAAVGDSLASAPQSCDPQRPELILRFSDGREPIHATVVALVRHDQNEQSHQGAGNAKVIGFEGTLPDNTHFELRRSGQLSMGHLEQVTSFSASSYPHNIDFAIFPANDSKCEEACMVFHAQGGTFTVRSIAPVFSATFELNALSKDKRGLHALPGTVSGCVTVPNR